MEWTASERKCRDVVQYKAIVKGILPAGFMIPGKLGDPISFHFMKVTFSLTFILLLLVHYYYASFYCGMIVWDCEFIRQISGKRPNYASLSVLCLSLSVCNTFRDPMEMA